MVQNNAWNNPRRADRQRQPNRVHHHRDERCCPNQRRPAELPLDLRGRALGPPRRWGMYGNRWLVLEPFAEAHALRHAKCICRQRDGVHSVHGKPG